jgi:hypothetical protein
MESLRDLLNHEIKMVYHISGIDWKLQKSKDIEALVLIRLY